MRAVRIHELGGPEVLRVDEVPVPTPGEGEVRVRHAFIGVNFIDTYHRTGLYSLPALPHGLGSEAAGTVEAVGSGVDGFSEGDRVVYFAGPPGSYADAKVVPAARLLKVPDAVGLDQAAATLVKGMTVEYLIHRTFEVKAGMDVLFHAAAGGVGLIACQWLAHLGARTIGTVSTEAKAELAKAHGCAEVIRYTEESVPERVRELTGGEGVPVVYDSVGKTTFMDSLKCLKPRGMLVGFGNASGTPEPFDVMELARNGSLFLTRPSLFHYTADRADLELSAGRLFDAIASGVVTPHIGATFPLAEARACHEALESRATVGSTLLVPE
ncbi:MAG: quinone oxidoreductase [Deltaproteobacteria bacterium]|nr:quinone oxidoreductase [Deltaproteobacteria bacterium]